MKEVIFLSNLYRLDYSTWQRFTRKVEWGEILFPNTFPNFTTDLNPTTKSTTTPTFPVAFDRMRDNGKTKKTAKSACNDATGKSLIYLFTGPRCAPQVASRENFGGSCRARRERGMKRASGKRYRSTRTTFLTLLETFRRIGRVRDSPRVPRWRFAIARPCCFFFFRSWIPF